MYLQVNDQFLTVKETASLLRVSPVTLKRWRKIGYGPACSRIGGKWLYAREDINKFFQDNSTANSNKNEPSQV